MTNITGLDRYGAIASLGKPALAPKQAQSSVSETENPFGAMLQSTARALNNAEAETARQLAGQGNMVDLVAAISAAEMAMETMSAVRDRVVSAYGEIMRMQV